MSKTSLICILAILSLLACGEPTGPRLAPDEHRLNVFTILSPDWSSQIVFMVPVSTGAIQQPSGTIYQDSTMVASVGPVELTENEWHPCAVRYGTIIITGGQNRCLDFSFTPHFGEIYEVRISADGWTTVQGKTKVPGNFHIVEARAEGNPPGTRKLHVTWTASKGVYRYLVAVRPETIGRCSHECGLRSGFLVTTDTVLNSKFPSDGIEGGNGPWSVEVYAVDEALYRFLTTGLDDPLFPVPPTQNVEGGYGVVGAWVLRSFPLGQDSVSS